VQLLLAAVNIDLQSTPGIPLSKNLPKDDHEN